MRAQLAFAALCAMCVLALAGWAVIRAADDLDGYTDPTSWEEDE